MSDGFPTLGPKIARPGQGMPRNDPGIDMSGDQTYGSGIFFAPGGQRGYGINVLPWNLIKPSTSRTVTINGSGGTTFSVDMPIDAGWWTIR